MKFVGVISIGDIQRAIIQKAELSDSILNHIRSDIVFAHPQDSKKDIVETMRVQRIECMPVVDNDFILIDIIEWDEIFDRNVDVKPVKCPVIIMAGGKGERLKPLTNMIPKPLIPVSDKTIIEEIICRFSEAKCTNFIISVNYKGEEIKKYFKEHKIDDCNITFVEEDRPLGTGGSLSLVKNLVTSTFFVSNCDILVDINLSDVFEYHKENHNAATIISIIKSLNIPYGIIETAKDGILINLKEKPNLSYQVNSGLYVMEPRILNYINDGIRIDMTELLLKARDKGERIGVFPIPEKAWTDMGNWEEYIKMIKGM